MAARSESGYSAKGKIYEIFETKVMSDKFRKREFVLEYGNNPQYPQYIKFDLNNDSCNLIDAFNKHDEVEVFFDLRGKPYKNRNGEIIYFTNLVVWRIVELNGKKADVPGNDSVGETPAVESTSESFEDLPF